jgi:hypothetical protein
MFPINYSRLAAQHVVITNDKPYYRTVRNKPPGKYSQSTKRGGGFIADGHGRHFNVKKVLYHLTEKLKLP